MTLRLHDPTKPPSAPHNPTGTFFNNGDSAAFYYPAPAGTYLSDVSWDVTHTDPVNMSEAAIAIQSNVSPFGYPSGITLPLGSPPVYDPGDPFVFPYSFPLTGLSLCYAQCDPTQGQENSQAELGLTALGTSPIYTAANKRPSRASSRWSASVIAARRS